MAPNIVQRGRYNYKIHSTDGKQVLRAHSQNGQKQQSRDQTQVCPTPEPVPPNHRLELATFALHCPHSHLYQIPVSPYSIPSSVSRLHLALKHPRYKWDWMEPMDPCSLAQQFLYNIFDGIWVLNGYALYKPYQIPLKKGLRKHTISNPKIKCLQILYYSILWNVFIFLLDLCRLSS